MCNCIYVICCMHTYTSAIVIECIASAYELHSTVLTSNTKNSMCKLIFLFRWTRFTWHHFLWILFDIVKNHYFDIVHVSFGVIININSFNHAFCQAKDLVYYTSLILNRFFHLFNVNKLQILFSQNKMTINYNQLLLTMKCLLFCCTCLLQFDLVSYCKIKHAVWFTFKMRCRCGINTIVVTT